MINRRLQALLQRNARPPSHHFSGKANVGLALLGVVGRQGLVDEFGLRACERRDGVGELNHGELAGVAEVDRASEVFGLVHQAHEAFDEVVHITKRAGLRAVAVEGDALALQRLDDEVTHYAAVVGVDVRAVGVEDARDLDVHAVLAAVVEEQGFCAALAFVVAGARTDGVDLAPQ